MSDVCYSDLLRQASHQLAGAARFDTKQDDPGYYSRRVLIAFRVADAAEGVAELEALGTPFGIGERLLIAAGPRLVQAVRLWSKVPFSFDTAEGWLTTLLANRAYMEAIDADDADGEARRRAGQEAPARPEPAPACPVPPKALSVADAARYVGASTATVEHLIKTRKLAYVQVGDQRGRTILVADLDKFLQERRQATGEELRRRGRPRRSS